MSNSNTFPQISKYNNLPILRITPHIAGGMRKMELIIGQLESIKMFVDGKPLPANSECVVEVGKSGKSYIDLQPESKYPFTFGVQGAKAILENVEKIKAFIASDGKSLKLKPVTAPAPQPVPVQPVQPSVQPVATLPQYIPVQPIQPPVQPVPVPSTPFPQGMMPTPEQYAAWYQQQMGMQPASQPAPQVEVMTPEPTPTTVVIEQPQAKQTNGRPPAVIVETAATRPRPRNGQTPKQAVQSAIPVDIIVQ